MIILLLVEHAHLPIPYSGEEVCMHGSLMLRFVEDAVEKR